MWEAKQRARQSRTVWTGVILVVATGMFDGALVACAERTVPPTGPQGKDLENCEPRYFREIGAAQGWRRAVLGESLGCGIAVDVRSERGFAVLEYADAARGKWQHLGTISAFLPIAVVRPLEIYVNLPECIAAHAADAVQCKATIVGLEGEVFVSEHPLDVLQEELGPRYALREGAQGPPRALCAEEAPFGAVLTGGRAKDGSPALKVAVVCPDSVAGRAGLSRGDLVLHVDESGASVEVLREIGRSCREEDGRTYRVVLERDKKIHTLLIDCGRAR